MFYMFGLFMNILSLILILALVAGVFVLLYFLIKKAVKDGILEANEAINKKDVKVQERQVVQERQEGQAAQERQEGQAAQESQESQVMQEGQTKC